MLLNEVRAPRTLLPLSLSHLAVDTPEFRKLFEELARMLHCEQEVAKLDTSAVLGLMKDIVENRLRPCMQGKAALGPDGELEINVGPFGSCSRRPSAS